LERLSKADSRERWRQIRALWGEFDPIGVGASESTRDEYDAYLGPTLRLLERRAPLDELQQYLATITLEHMGLSDSPQFQMARRQFARRLRDWCEAQWPGSHV
jgi:hypothetical protein